MQMLTFFIVAGSIALIVLCAWLLLLILMQKPSANAGMGAALGGGVAGSVFGGEASNVLTRWTVYGVIGFFLLTFALSWMQIYQHHHQEVAPELAPMAEEEVVKPGSLTQLPSSANETSETAHVAEKPSTSLPKTPSAKPTSRAPSAKPSAVQP